MGAEKPPVKGTPQPKPAAATAAAAPAAAKAKPGAQKPGRVMPKSTRVTLSKGGSKVGTGLLKQAKEKDAPPEKIEERALALPAVAAIKDLGIFRDFLHKLLPIYRIQATSYEVLKSFVNIDVTAERVAASLAANPYYSYQFFRNIESMGKREELPSAESAVVLYGMQNSRNFILAMQLIRSITGTHPEWSKEGKLKTVPSDVLKYALKIEEILAGNKSGYADTAYAGGLMFDIVANYALQVVEDKKRISDVIETSYKHGLLSAKIGMELARNIPEFGFTKYIFSACLIHDIGKLAIAVLDPGYLNFLEECSNRGLPRTVRVFAEQQQYGVNHALLGGLLARAFKIFLPVEKAIFYHHAPYLLRASNKNLYQLAAMICLATNMASNFKKVDKADDPVLLSWNTPELGGFKVNARMMMNASAKIL